LIAVAWRATASFPLVLAANRDEFHDRPSAPANWWPHAADVLGGVDLRAGGSWLAVDKAGRLAAVTNIRGSHPVSDDARSRGHLVSEFLIQPKDPSGYIDELQAAGNAYAPFNLLIADSRRLAYYSNENAKRNNLPPGLYGLSNASLDTPWPKVNMLKDALSLAIREPDPVPLLFQALADNQPAPDHLLPETGVELAWERRLSAPFILSRDYGTRCSTVVVQQANGDVRFAERRFDMAGNQVGGSEFNFSLA
jgi:uncharacterized protein with NRDE domain